MIVFDTETEPIVPGLLTPKLVCLSWCNKKADSGHLLDREEALAFMRWALEKGEAFCGHNVCFDFAVLANEDPALMPLIFKAYEENRVTDVMIRQQLLDIAEGQYFGERGLSFLHEKYCGSPLEKDEWRMRYAEFRDVCLERWPSGARLYPRMDAEATRDVLLSQNKQKDLLADQFRQARAYWALHLSSCNGIHTDPIAVAKLRNETERQREAIEHDLLNWGLLKTHTKRSGEVLISRDTKRAKALMEEVCSDPRRTPTGQVALDEEACQSSGDSRLIAYAEYSTLAKVLANDVKQLERGLIQTRYGMAETGRTTSKDPNIQNIRRLPGVRECYIPRPGYVFAQADYSSFELFCLAQSCLDFLGESALAKALNGGLDPHCVLASQILRRPYEDVFATYESDPVVEAARQTAKVANFGFGGGLGSRTLVGFAKKGYNVVLTEEQASELKYHWFQAWPEMRDFFVHVKQLGVGDEYRVRLPRSNRVRGKATFTAAANTHFQGPAADAGKHACWLVAKEQYTVPSSALFGSRTAVFVHDELIVQAPLERAPEAAERLSQVMLIAAREFLPDMTGLKAKPCLMARWSKKAKQLRDAEGKLMVWG